MPDPSRSTPPSKGQYALPRWAWAVQVLFFHVLATGIVVYELAFAPTFHFEALVFAGWLLLLPNAVNGQGIFKLLRGQ